MADEQESKAQAETLSAELLDHAEEIKEVQESAPSQEQFYREKSTFFADQKPSRIQKLKDFIFECKRVLLITKKPNKDELKTIVKVSGMGMLVIGLIGFLIHFAREVLFK